MTQPKPSTPSISKLQATKLQVRRVWALSKPYFHSEEKWRARLLLGAIVTLNLALVYMNVLFNDWNRLFYDALQEKNSTVFWEQLGRFTYLAFAFIAIAVYKFYLTQLLEVRWRAWMTRQYMGRWLGNQSFYHFELARYASATQNTNSLANPDNPDQRIQEDVSQFTGLTLSLSMGLLNSLVTLGSFVGILWTLSGSFSFSLMGSDYSIPGFMVWMAVLYCGVGSVLTHYIGRRQIGLNFQQQRVEADFRHRMLRVREYAESIALDKGESVERSQLESRFGKVLTNYLALLSAQKQLVWFTSFFGQAAVVFPFVVAAPRFFSGAIQLGQLTQIAGAFAQVQGALSWFVDNFPNIAIWRATTDRLTGFEAAFGSVGAVGYASATVPDSTPGVTDLNLSLPNGALLLAHTALQTANGDRILLKGPSGSGKSTLFRAIAGLWPFATGAVQRPHDVMFLPQRAYFPEGSLRDALAYPAPAEQYTDASLQAALRDALLPHLADQLDTSDAWGQKLSGGEQQRLAMARVFLKKPAWVFADEATSALDEAAEATLYERLTALVAAQNGGLVSIAHRPGVVAFHNRQWLLERQDEHGTQAPDGVAPLVAPLFKLSEKPL
jgi:putative ATP-binding cassette transporter